jgi:NitT/TauT family transport system ATP-binding protein
MVTHNIEEAVLMCDRILVFSSNPGRIVAEIKVDLPQPRNRQDPKFRKMVDDIYVRMTQPAVGAKEGRRDDGLFPGLGIAMVLPRVSTNTLAGLMEAVAGDPFKGKADLPDLARVLHYEADELFGVAETLQLMRFAELEGGDLRLTPAAKGYVEAETDARKQLFAKHLLAYVPLAAHIRHQLTEDEPELSAGGVRETLEETMSPEYAEETLKSVIDWARYAEAFAYDESADLFTLDNPS